MNDLISRADAIAYIDRVIKSGLGRYKSLNYIRKYISALPSANAKQGKWLTDKGKSLMICSVCGTLFNKHTDFFDFEEFANFCPYCGAIMKGGDDK